MNNYLNINRRSPYNYSVVDVYANTVKTAFILISKKLFQKNKFTRKQIKADN